MKKKAPQSTAAQEAATRNPLRTPMALVLRVALLWCVGWFFFVFHGLSFHLTPWSQAFINAIVKYAYDPRGENGQQDTTVLLFREENLQDFRTHYPVPYRIHAQVLEALSIYAPRAVFVDFVFVDAREGDQVEELAQSVCILSEAGTKVFLAAPVKAVLGNTVREELLKCAQRASPHMDREQGVSGVLTYANGAWDGEDFLPSAAFAVAADKLGIDPRRAEPLEIIWGKGVAELNRKWMKCEDPTLLQVFKATLFHGPLATKLSCPYTRTLSVNHLLNSTGDQDVHKALHGKTVFYGAAFRMTGDRVNSPVYAEMPGVYLHAMAYDNLATFRAHYKRSERHGLLARLLDAALLFIAALLLLFQSREEAPKPKTRTEFISKIGYPLWMGAAFFLGAWIGGFDVGLLALFAAYVVYRWRVVRDMGFVWQTIVTIASALFAYAVLDLGPRNILAFLVFFEVIRHVQEWLKHRGAEYGKLKPTVSSGFAGYVWKAADFVFSLFRPSHSATHPRKETSHASKPKK